MNNNESKVLVGLYHYAEDYFFKAISIKSLNIDNIGTAYMTKVPVADLNIVYIREDITLSVAFMDAIENFYIKENLDFIIIVPELFSNVLKNENYSKVEKSTSMFLDLGSFHLNKIDDLSNYVVIKATDNKLDEWMIPMIAFSTSSDGLCLKYADAHRLAIKRKANIYHYSLYVEEKPVSSITLSFHNEVARIDDLGTVPEFQGRGYATKLITYALLKAKTFGANYCFLEASEVGLLIYQKLGFEILFKNDVYIKKK